VFVFQNFKKSEIEIPGLTLKPYNREQIISKDDLALNTFESKGQIFLSMEYSTKLFKKETIERFIVYFKKIVTDIISNPSKKIADIEIMTDKEIDQILTDIKSTELDAEFNF
jgi:hypothetical protein